MFGGGFTYGVRQAGVEVPTVLESTDFGVDTARLNNPGVEHVVGYENWGPALKRFLAEHGKPDLVAGNPACSAWSQIGRSNSSKKRGFDQWRTDPNLQQTVDHVAIGLRLRPAFWVTESVPGFERRGAAAEVARLWMDHGYNVTLIREDAKFMGLPQQRRRNILVAHWPAFEPRFPPFEGMVPVGMALEGVEYSPDHHDPMYPEYAELLESLKPGEHLGNAVPDGWVGHKPRMIDHRVHWDLPSGTIAGNEVYYHPHEPRKLGYRELAALCGYPPDWQFGELKYPGRAVMQLAKAVLPLVGKWVAGETKRALEEWDVQRGHSQTATRVTHWSTSGKLKDFNLVSYSEPWDEPASLAPDAVWWLADRTRDTLASWGI